MGIGGYPFIGTFIDKQLISSYRNCLIPSIFLATVISLICLRNFTLSLVVFVTAIGAAGLSVAMIPICGVKYGGLMSIIPALVFVLATSGSIHLIRYGLESIGDPVKLLSIGWKPCAISATTTAGWNALAGSKRFSCNTEFWHLLCFWRRSSSCVSIDSRSLAVVRFGQTGSRKLAHQNSQSTFWVKLLGLASTKQNIGCRCELGIDGCRRSWTHDASRRSRG